MKQKHPGRWYQAVLSPIALLFLSFYFMTISCTKKTEPVSRPADLTTLAKESGGEIFSGKLSTSLQEDGLVLICNDGREYLFLIEKPGPFILAPDATLFQAEILCLQSGIIVRDKTNNNTWVYENKDSETNNQFDRVKMSGKSLTSPISGYTRIKPS